MEKIVKLFGNVVNSPKNTILGCVFMLVGLYMMDETGVADLGLTSVSVIFFVIGGYLIVSKDTPSKTKSKQKE